MRCGRERGGRNWTRSPPRLAACANGSGASFAGTWAARSPRSRWIRRPWGVVIAIVATSAQNFGSCSVSWCQEGIARAWRSSRDGAIKASWPSPDLIRGLSRPSTRPSASNARKRQQPCDRPPFLPVAPTRDLFSRGGPAWMAGRERSLPILGCNGALKSPVSRLFARFFDIFFLIFKIMLFCRFRRMGAGRRRKEARHGSGDSAPRAAADGRAGHDFAAAADFRAPARGLELRGNRAPRRA